jgi:hypothetical protein
MAEARRGGLPTEHTEDTEAGEEEPANHANGARICLSAERLGGKHSAMKTLLFVMALIGSALAAEKAKEELVFPIAEMKLTNGRVWKNVTVVRYDKDTVVLKSAAGVGPLSYSLIPEPTRGLMLAERNNELTKDKKQRAERNQTEQSEYNAGVARKARVDDAIRRNAIIVGMTKDEVRKSWGEPERNNSSSGSYGAHDQWIYPSAYIYFRDGQLTSWQDR